MRLQWPATITANGLWRQRVVDVNQRWRRHARSASRRTQRRRSGVRRRVPCPQRTLPPGRHARRSPRGAGAVRARQSPLEVHVRHPTRRARLRPRGYGLLGRKQIRRKKLVCTAVEARGVGFGFSCPRGSTPALAAFALPPGQALPPTSTPYPGVAPARRARRWGAGAWRGVARQFDVRRRAAPYPDRAGKWMVCMSTLLSLFKTMRLTGLGTGAGGWPCTLYRTKEPLELKYQYQRNSPMKVFWKNQKHASFSSNLA